MIFASLVPDSTACGDPEQPVSSLVTRSDPARVTYSCVKGYRLEGAAERLCLVHEGGRWEGKPPTCIGAYRKISLAFEDEHSDGDAVHASEFQMGGWLYKAVS